MDFRPRKRSAEDPSFQVLKKVKEQLEDALLLNEAGIPKERKPGAEGKSDGFDKFVEAIMAPFNKDRRVTEAEEVILISYDAFKAKSEEGIREKEDSMQTPDSVEDFKARLATYGMIRWSRKPDCIASFHCARFGWKLIEDMDALVCVKCKQSIPVSPGTQGLSPPSGNNSKLRRAIESTAHAANCPWRTYFSPVTILSLPNGFEMYHYLKSGVLSLQGVTTFTLQINYWKIMMDLDLQWMKDITGYSVGDTLSEKCSRSNKDEMNQLIHFLVLNGWTKLSSNIDDSISCQSCLRQVPVWLRKSSELTEREETTETSSSAPCSMSTRATTTVLTDLDPVNNHWWWCPWRRFLEFSQVSEMNNKLFLAEDLESINFFEQRFEDSTLFKSKADEGDYLRLKELILAECAQASFINEKKTMGADVIAAVGTIMDDFISPSQTQPPSLNNTCEGPKKILAFSDSEAESTSDQDSTKDTIDDSENKAVNFDDIGDKNLSYECQIVQTF